MKKFLLLLAPTLLIFSCISPEEPEWAVYEKAGLTFNYPKGWLVSESGTLGEIRIELESQPRPETKTVINILTIGTPKDMISSLEDFEQDKGLFKEETTFKKIKEGKFAGFSTFERDYIITKTIRDSNMKAKIHGKVLAFKCRNLLHIISFEGDPQKLRFNSQWEKWMEESFSCQEQ